MAAYELKTFLDDIYEATGESHDCDFNVSTILNHFIDYFSDNIYVLKYNKRNHITQEDNSLLHEEENEEAIVSSKLGEAWHLTPSPSISDNNSKIEYALDGGLFLLDNSSCLENTMLCEDKNDKLAVFLIHENPMLLL
jgi:hypothetical protein